MYYHIKLTMKNGKTICLYDKDENYAKIIKNKFSGNDDFIMEGNRVEIKELESCKIIVTEYNSDFQVERLKSLYPGNPIFRENLFNDFDNIFDKI